MWMNMTKLRRLLLLLLIWDGVYGALVILQLCGIRLSWLASDAPEPMRLVSAVLIAIALVIALAGERNRQDHEPEDVP